MQGYRDPDLKPDLDALVRSDHSSAYCLGQTLLAVLFVLFVFAAIVMIGFYFYLRRLP